MGLFRRNLDLTSLRKFVNPLHGKLNNCCHSRVLYFLVNLVLMTDIDFISNSLRFNLRNEQLLLSFLSLNFHRIETDKRIPCTDKISIRIANFEIS